jgi:hypothetical protein
MIFALIFTSPAALLLAAIVWGEHHYGIQR